MSSAVMPFDDYKAACNAARKKAGTTELIKSGELAYIIETIKTAPVLQELTITKNGEYTPPDGMDGFSKVIANVVGAGGNTFLEDELLAGSLTEYTNDRITTLKAYAFYHNTAIERVSFPNVTTFTGSNTFYGCEALVSINFPKLVSVGTGNAFTNCKALTEVVLPYVIATPTFKGCSKLKKVDISNPEESSSILAINNGALSDTAVDTLIIRSKRKIFTLSSLGAFTNSPFASGGTGGTVYVPEALIESYKTAPNWSALYAAGTCNFVAIEGSEYE